MSQPSIRVEKLTKRYKAPFGGKTVDALSGIDLEVAPGELFGLLGPNGAGKTTTVKILLGLTRASSGVAELAGLPVSNPACRRRVGYLPEGHRFPGYLTARETLSIFGRMSGLDRATIAKRTGPLLEQVRIQEWADVRVRKFSKGMTQRLGLACAMIHDPDILLLDEPTDGVDPVGRREIRDLLREYAATGKTVFVNSHLLSEIELTCDRVAVLRKGKVAAHGRIADLTTSESRYRMIASPMPEGTLASFRESGATVERMNGHFLLGVRDTEHLNALIDRLRADGGLLSELAPMRSTLEDVFVDLVRTGDAADAAGAAGTAEATPSAGGVS